MIMFALLVTKFEGEVLRLYKVQRSDMGAYLCIASNNVPPAVSKRIILKVNCKKIDRKSCPKFPQFPVPFSVKPEVTIPSQLIGVPLGKDIELSCNVQAFPESINYWMVNDMIMNRYA